MATDPFNGAFDGLPGRSGGSASPSSSDDQFGGAFDGLPTKPAPSEPDESWLDRGRDLYHKAQDLVGLPARGINMLAGEVTDRLPGLNVDSSKGGQTGQAAMNIARDPLGAIGAGANAAFGTDLPTIKSNDERTARELKDLTATNPTLGGAAGAAASGLQRVGEFGGGMVFDPVMGLIPESKAVGAAFLPGMIQGAYEGGRGAWNEYKANGITPEFGRDVADMLSSGALAGLTGAHLASGKHAPVETAKPEFWPGAVPPEAAAPVDTSWLQGQPSNAVPPEFIPPAPGPVEAAPVAPPPTPKVQGNTEAAQAGGSTAADLRQRTAALERGDTRALDATVPPPGPSKPIAPPPEASPEATQPIQAISPPEGAPAPVPVAAALPAPEPVAGAPVVPPVVDRNAPTPENVAAFFADGNVQSTSTLQRRFRIGFKQASQLLDDYKAGQPTPAPQESAAPVDTTPSPALERRQAYSPDAEAQRIAARRTELAAEGHVPEDHPLVQRVLDAETRANEAGQDELTGVGTGSAYHRAAAAGKPAAVSEIDVAGAGATNKEFGEKYTDARLAAAGQALKAIVGDRGEVFRKGGDEFVVHWYDAKEGADAHPELAKALDQAHVVVRDADGNAEAAWTGVEHYAGFGHDFDTASRNVYARKPAVGSAGYKALPAGLADKITAGRENGGGVPPGAGGVREGGESGSGVSEVPARGDEEVSPVQRQANALADLGWTPEQLAERNPTDAELADMIATGERPKYADSPTPGRAMATNLGGKAAENASPQSLAERQAALKAKQAELLKGSGEEGNPLFGGDGKKEGIPAKQAAAAPVAAPKEARPQPPAIEKAAPPERRLKIQRGLRGSVDVEFEHPNDKDLFSAPGRSKKQMSGEPGGRSPDWDGLAKRYGVSRSKLYDLALQYSKDIKAAIKGLKEGEVYKAPAPDVEALRPKEKLAPLRKDSEGHPVLPGQEDWTPAERGAVRDLATYEANELAAMERHESSRIRPFVDAQGKMVTTQVRRNGRVEDSGFTSSGSKKSGTPLEDLPYSPKEVVAALKRDKGNPVEVEVLNRYRDDPRVDEALAAKGEGDASFNPEELDKTGSDKYAVQKPMFGGEMLQGTETRKTEGREADGPLFRQEADARAREEAKAQRTLPLEPDHPATLPAAREAFPGLKFETDENGDHVAKLKDGGELRVSPVGDIEVRDGAALAQSAKAGGVEGEATPVGSFQRVGADGVVQIAKKAPATAIHHEAFHFFFDRLPEKMKDAILKHYGDEESAAYAYQEWTPKRVNGWFSTILASAQRVYRAFRPTYESVFGDIRSGRAAKGLAAAEGEGAQRFAINDQARGKGGKWIGTKIGAALQDELSKLSPDDPAHAWGEAQDFDAETAKSVNIAKADAEAITPFLKRTAALDPANMKSFQRQAITQARDLLRQIEEGQGQKFAVAPSPGQKGIPGIAPNVPSVPAKPAPTLADQFIEGWRSGLVSAPGTQLANPGSNVGEASFRAGESALAGVIDRALGGVRSRYSGEALEQIKGGFSKIPDAMKTLSSGLKDILKDDPNFPGKIPGKAGAVIRVPLKLLGVGDATTATMNEGAVSRGIAYRMAKNELPGGTRAAIEARQEQIIQNPTKEFTESVQNEVDSRQFKGKDDPDSLIGILKDMRNKHKWLNAVIPFLETPGHIAKLAIQRSPVGFKKAFTDYREYKAALANGITGDALVAAKGKAVDSIARPLLGTAMLGLFAAYAKAGGMTGSGPTDPKAVALKKKTGWQPYSFKVGDTYIPYNRFEPASSLLGIAADMAELKDQHKLGDMFDKGLGSIMSNLTSKTYLAGLANASAMIANPKQFASQYVSGLAGSLVPNIVSKAAQAIDPAERDTSTTNKGLAGIPEKIGNTLMSRIPGLSQMLPERKTATGETAERLGGNAASRFLSPVQITSDKPEADVERFLLDKDFVPGQPSRDYKVPGSNATMRLTEDEMATLQDSNRVASDYVRSHFLNNPAFDKLDAEDQKKRLEAIFSKARANAKDKLRSKYAFRQRENAAKAEASA